MNVVWKNWARTVRSRPRAIHRPRSEADIQQLIRDGSAAGQRVKAVGSGHSPAPIAASDDAQLIDLSRMNRVVRIDRKAGEVTVEAGMRLENLNELLAREGLALANLGSISEQTVAGAVATGTHGTGRMQPGLADMLTGLRLVTAGGECIQVGANGTDAATGGTRSKMSAGLELDAARVHLGLLGVLSQASLRVTPAFRLHAIEETRPLDEVCARLDEFMLEPYFRFWWFPWTDLARVWVARPTELEPDPPRPAFQAYVQDSLLGNRMSEALYACARSHPAAVRAVNRTVRRLLFTDRTERVDRSDRIFNFLIQVRQYVMEYAIPIEHTATALHELKALIERENFGAHVPVEVRFTPPARGWLDMAHDRATCYIGVIMYKPFGADIRYREYFRAVDGMLRAYSGRPHWAKVHFRNREDLRGLYPRFDDFERVRKQLDPEGIFLNDYLRRFF